MKIAMYMPGLRSGSMSWDIYQDFAAAMRTAGADFVLLTDVPPHDHDCPEGTVFLPPAPLAARLDHLARPFTRANALLATTARIRRWLRANRSVDAIYMEMTYPLGAAAWLATVLSGWTGTLIMTPMGEDFLVLEEVSYGHRRRRCPRWLIDKTMRAASAIRCISPMVKEYASGFQKPMGVIPLNVANSTLQTKQGGGPDRQTAREHVRETLRLDRRGLVLSLGRLHPFKGIHVLLESMLNVPDADLLVAGPSLAVAGFGDYKTYLERQAQQLGIADRVHLLGTVPHAEVTAMMSAADVVVVPSLLESMNRVCAEAAASGTPFIVTASTGAADLISEPGVGQIVAPRDSAGLATAINRVLEGEWQGDPAATQRFLHQFDASQAAPRLLDLIVNASAGS